MSDLWKTIKYKGFEGTLVAKQITNRRLTGVLLSFNVPKIDDPEFERFAETMKISKEKPGRVVNRIIPVDEIDEKL